MNQLILTAFSSELEKIALRLKGVHGTYEKFKVLKGGVGKANLLGDPNPRALYIAGKGGKARDNLIREFAERSVKAQGKGTPVKAQAVMDTAKGWEPRALSAFGRKNIGTVEDAKDLIDEIDFGLLSASERGESYKRLNKGVGSWWNPENPGSTLKPTKWGRA